MWSAVLLLIVGVWIISQAVVGDLAGRLISRIR